MFIFFNSAQAQYNPGAFHYGLAAIKGFESVNEVGVGARAEYAYNCYNTFLVEFNHLFSVGNSIENESYSEFALGTN